MAKILSQAGTSLADMYNVEGSIAGIDQLNSEEVQLVHEMGHTIFSERLSMTVRRRTTGAIAQNIAFDQLLTDLPTTPTRILGVAVISNNVTRLNNVSLAAQDPIALREVPFWVWDSAIAAPISLSIRIQDDGGGAANLAWLRGTELGGLLPSMLTGVGQPQRVPDIAFRGLTNGFGAGTVTTTALILIGFSQVGGLNSRGLPIPSW